MNWLLEKLITLNIAYAETGGNNTRHITIQNPLGEGATFKSIIGNINDFLVSISIPILTLIVLYAAFIMLTAGGDEKKFSLGKNVLLYAAIGFAILLAAEGLINLLEVILTGQNVPL